MELDARVHRFIYRCAANPFLEETLGRYFNLSLRIWYLVIDRLPHLFARVHEHQDVLLAISAGEPARARDTLAGHIATFEQRDPLGPLRRSIGHVAGRAPAGSGRPHGHRRPAPTEDACDRRPARVCAWNAARSDAPT